MYTTPTRCKSVRLHANTSLAGAWVIIKVSGHQYWWLADGYNLEIGHFLEVAGWCLPG